MSTTVVDENKISKMIFLIPKKYYSIYKEATCEHNKIKLLNELPIMKLSFYDGVEYLVNVDRKCICPEECIERFKIDKNELKDFLSRCEDWKIVMVYNL